MRESFRGNYLRLQDMRDGIWVDRMAGDSTLREMKAQMLYIDTQRANWPQRIVDVVGNVLIVNQTAAKSRSRPNPGGDVLGIPPSTLIVVDRVFVALRKAKRLGRTSKYHAVTPYCRMALCSAKPSKTSGWAEPPAQDITCPHCLKKLASLAAAAHETRDPAGQLRTS